MSWHCQSTYGWSDPSTIEWQENVTEITAFLRGYNWTDEAIAGVIGNMVSIALQQMHGESFYSIGASGAGRAGARRATESRRGKSETQARGVPRRVSAER